MSLRTIVCASGELGFSTLKQMNSKIKIVGILTDGSSTKIIDWANENKLPIFIGNPRNRDFVPAIKELGNIDLLLSLHYLFIIEKNLIDIPRLLAMNIHGGMLPNYRGRAPHIWAIINGEKSLGITIHKIDEGCDTGDIILQKEIELTHTITGGDILKIFAAEYPVMLSSAIELLEQDKIKLRAQDHSAATYFGKREPHDGEVCWNWTAEKIYNWVRALTAPYPGAFTFINNEQVFIWKVEDSQMSFLDTLENGRIVKRENDQLFVKVSDKILKITHFTQSGNFQIAEGDVFQSEKNI